MWPGDCLVDIVRTSMNYTEDSRDAACLQNPRVVRRGRRKALGILVKTCPPAVDGGDVTTYTSSNF